MTYVPRKARKSELRHSGWIELGEVGGRLTSIETPARMPPLLMMDFIALTKEAEELFDVTRERGMRPPPRLSEVMFISGFKALKAS